MTHANVTRDYTDVVAPAQLQAYEAGEKALNQCFREHGVKYTWKAWAHVTGNTYSYSYVSDPVTWADFDAMRQEFHACESVYMNSVNPHLLTETSSFMTLAPGMSNMPKGVDAGDHLIKVVTFTLKGGHASHEAFKNSVKMVYAAFAKTHRPDYSMTFEVNDGRSGAPDFILVIPHKDWADFGRKINPPLWTMMAKVYGADKAQGIRKALNAAIASSSSHVDRYDADLSYTAGH